jgi:hypothetical protein
MLKAIPVKNPAAATADSDSDQVRLTVKRKKPAFLVPPVSWLIRPRMQKRVQLDRVGTWVWRICDGNRSVEAVIDRFAEKYALTFHEARVTVTKYLKLLVEWGIIAMVSDEEG